MSKKIFIVSSSPRKNGNSDFLAEEFARGAREAGHAVEKVNLRDMELKFCTGCLSCLKRGECILKDGVNALLPRVSGADVLVFATPIYYYEMSGQLKTFLDRMNPLYPKENSFREVYLLAASADDAPEAMDGAVKGNEGWVACFDGVCLKGVVRGTGANAAGEIKGTKAAGEAYEAGRAV